MVDLSVTIGGLTLANPVMPGSGTFAEAMADVFDLDLLTTSALERAALAACVIAVVWLGTAWALA